MRKTFILWLLLIVFLSSAAVAFKGGKTSVLVDGMSVKELKGIRFTVLSLEVRKENEGPLRIDGKLIATGSSSLLDRIVKSNSKFEIVVTNSLSDKEDAEELAFINCQIKSVSKSPDQWVYLFEAEALK